MGLHNTGDRLTCLDLLYPRLSCYNSAYKGMIGLSVIANPGELGPICALPKDNGLFNTQVVQVELAGVDLNKCSHFLNIYLDTCLGLTDINVRDQIQSFF